MSPTGVIAFAPWQKKKLLSSSQWSAHSFRRSRWGGLAYEVKVHGYRAIGVKTSREAILYSRNGKNFNKRYPYLSEVRLTGH
jgi:ATP-dependent DNA ligase